MRLEFSQATKKARWLHPEQAGIACEDPKFWAYLNERCDIGVTEASAAAVAVRNWCLVKSRADLDTLQVAGLKWDKLYGDYQMWRRGAAA